MLINKLISLVKNYRLNKLDIVESFLLFPGDYIYTFILIASILYKFKIFKLKHGKGFK